MKVYLVGGAVRDELLGLPVRERDWVVVGAQPEEMEQLGYRPVGRDFPVFLHPQTQEEYALARLERKTGPGYRGFVTQSSPEVTLEEDLRRRDLTVNAMARDADGALVDPYGGQQDLQARRLRHVSPAFVEDPVRVLRVARFAARFAGCGFSVAPETLALMREMTAAGEVDALVPERVWKEMERALTEPAPAAFFDTLRDAGALAIVMPELAQLSTSAGTGADAGAGLARTALAAAVAAGRDARVRFAALLSTLPVPAVESLCRRLRIPNEYSELALLAARMVPGLAGGGDAPHAGGVDADAEALLAVLETADALRRPERFELLLQTAAACGAPEERLEQLRRLRPRVAAVTLTAEELASLRGRGAEIAATLRTRRLDLIRARVRT
jgi:tRNA nucleotidyltransferase (CCA-adding enzyme)